MENVACQLESVIAGMDRSGSIAARFSAIKQVIDDEVSAQRKGDAPRSLELPVVTETELQEMLEVAKREHQELPESARVLLDFLGSTPSNLRVLLLNNHENNQAVIHGFTKVPPRLSRMVVLDASYPVRTLIRQSNENISPDHERLASILISKTWPGVVSQFKRYDHVTIHHMQTRGSGRSFVTRDFRRPFGESEVDREVAHVVSTMVPRDKAVLIWTFKQREKHEPDYIHRIRRAIRAARVDPDEKLKVGEREEPRVIVETFGRETSSNRWKHCEYVIFTGCIEPDLSELTASYLAEMRRLHKVITNAEIQALLRGEIWHRLLQGMSRAAMRDVWVDQEGQSQAKAVHVYIFSRHPQITEELGRVLPGAKWQKWAPSYIGRNRPTKEDELATRISDLMAKVPTQVLKVSVRDLKGMDPKAFTGVTNLTFQRARDKALDGSGWTLKGRSFVRDHDGDPHLAHADTLTLSRSIDPL